MPPIYRDDFLSERGQWEKWVTATFLGACCFQRPGEKPSTEYLYIFQFTFSLIYFILFFNADQTGFLSTMIRNLHYSLLLDFYPMSGFSSLTDSDSCDMFRIMLPRLAMSAYSLQSDSCKLFIGCFKNHRLFICINGILIHKSLSTSLVRIFFFFI